MCIYFYCSRYLVLTVAEERLGFRNWQLQSPSTKHSQLPAAYNTAYMRIREGLCKSPHLAFSRNERRLSPSSAVSLFEAPCCMNDDDLDDVTAEEVVVGRT